MKLLILAMLLSVVETGPPIPRQTPNSAARTSQENNNQTNGKQKPANAMPEIAGKEQPVATNGNRGNQAEKNENNPVKISELPPVTVLSSKRDWVDWGYWGFGALLALTGILQIGVLWKNLKISTKQAEIAKNQEIQMVQAGEQTERIIAQMKESEVRDLRAYVGVSKVILNLQKLDVPRGIVETQNFGKTPAYKVRQWVGIAINSYPLTGTLPESSNPTDSSVSVIFPGIKNVNVVDLRKPIPPNVLIGTPSLTIYVYGRVTYEDAFKNEWHSNYRFFFGGPQGGQTYRDDRQMLMGAMYPDSEGNDAT